MKKLLTAVVAMVMVLSLTCVAFADGSPSTSADVKGTDPATGAEVAITEADATVILTREEAAQIIGCDVAEVEVLWNKDLTAATLPVTLTFTAPVSAGQSLYAFHHTGAWAVIGSAEASTVSAEVASMSPFALVIRTPAKAADDSAAPAQGGKSSNTGEGNAIPFVLAAVLAAGALAFVMAPKKRNA